MREFVDEVAVLSQWLGRDLAADLTGVVPIWNAFRFRDATVFEAELPVCAGRKYLVRGTSVRELIPSQVTIDQAYLELGSEREALPAVA